MRINKNLQAPTWEQLSPEQKAGYETIKNNKYTFLTGGGGVGKSALVKFVMEKIPHIEVVASTGVAAVNVGGKTFHSWSAIGLGDLPKEALYNQIKAKKHVCAKLRQSQHVLIDEVSMLDGETIDKVDYILRRVRGSSQPFGGISVTLVGDALQLPVVRKEKGFFFESNFWKESQPKMIYLEKVFRQENVNFVEVLSKLRRGIVDKQVIELIEAAQKNKPPVGGVRPVIIHCKNIDVDSENQKNYIKIVGEENSYYSLDYGDENAIKNLDKNCPAQKLIKLKVGAQIMLLQNLDTEGGLVNGSVGVVDGFTPDKAPIVKFVNGRREIIERNLWEIKETDIKLSEITGQKKYKVLASREQIPLRLCWSVTAHKIQGSTLDYAEVDLSKAFEFGQCYVSLSRVKDEKGLFIRGINYDAIKAHPKCLDFYGYDENGNKKK